MTSNFFDRLQALSPEKRFDKLTCFPDRLAKVNQVDRLHYLLREEVNSNSHGIENIKNAWYEAKRQIRDTEGYSNNIRLARSLSEKAGVDERHQNSGKQIGLLYRYALIFTSLNSLSMNIPPDLLLVATRNSVLSPLEALTIIQQLSDDEQKAKMLIGLIPDLDVSLLDQSIGIIQRITNVRHRVTALTQSAYYFSLSEKLLEQVFNVVLELPDTGRDGLECPLIKGLVGIAPYLKESQLKEALIIARRLDDRYYKDGEEALVGLLPRLAQLDKPDIALTLIQEKNWYTDGAQERVLGDIIPSLPERLLSEACAMVPRLRDLDAKQRVLGQLALRFAKQRWFQQALATAQEITSDFNRCKLLAELSLHLPEPWQSEALQQVSIAAQRAVETIHETLKYSFKGECALAIAELVPYLPESQHDAAVQKILKEIEFIQENPVYMRTKVLIELASLLPTSQVHHILAAVQGSKYTFDRIAVLEAIAPRLPEHLFPAARALIKPLAKNVDSHAAVIIAISPCLCKQSLQHILEALSKPELPLRRILASAPWTLPGKSSAGKSISPPLALVVRLYSEATKAFVLRAIALYIPEDSLPQALETAKKIKNAEDRVQVLMALMPRLHNKLDCLNQVVSAINDINSDNKRIQTMIELILSVPQSLQADALRKMLPTIQLIDDEEQWVQSLAELTPYLPISLRRQKIEQVIRGVRAILTEDEYCRAMKLLLPLLGSQGDHRQALAIVQKVQSNDFQAEALTGIALSLSQQGDSVQALDVAQTIGSSQAKALVLAELVSFLPEPQRTTIAQQVVTIVQEMGWRRETWAIMQKLAPDLAELLIEQELGKVQALVEMRARNFAYGDEDLRLSELIPYLSKRLLPEALKIARNVPSNRRDAILIALAPRLAEEGYPQVAIDAAQKIESEHERVKVLALLVPCLPDRLREDMLPSVLAGAQAITHKRHQVVALAALVPYFSEPLQSEIFQYVLSARIGDQEYVVALAKMAKCLSPTQREHVFELAMHAALRISSPNGRASAFDQLAELASLEARGESLWQAMLAVWEIRDAPKVYLTNQLEQLACHLAQLPYPILYPLWCKMLDHFAKGTRQELLNKTRILVPIMVALGGAEAVTEAFCAVHDIGRWWPSRSSRRTNEAARKAMRTIIQHRCSYLDEANP